MKACALSMAIAFAAHAQIDPGILKPVGYHPGPVAYYNAPYFANALYEGGEWFAFTGSEFGAPIDFNSAQFENGYPKFLPPGQKLRAAIFGLNVGAALAKGRIVVTWKGNADVRLARCRFEGPGAETGSIADGRRVYLCDEPAGSIEVHAIATPITEARVWLDSVEGQLFHPLLLQRIADADWSFIRFMDWGATNASPQQDWSDRRRPSHIFMNGVLHARAPAPGADGNRETGVAFEHMVALCNATGRNLWINVPHLATDGFIARLAKLIRFGSDGVNPYDGPQANPLFAPLRSDLRVYVEYSNEIWSGGFSFPQGDWAEDQAVRRGLTRARFNARRFCDTWRIFQQVFDGPSRLVRVAATFTALDAYSRPFLQELGSYGAGLDPPVRPDVLAVTTYFGNDIQRFVQQHGTANAFEEWKRRILGGDAASGSGPDATGIGGGFSASLRTLPTETLGYTLPIVAYEGGPSLYTVDFDDTVTSAVVAMNRDPRIAEVYRIHLELARSKGLWTHTPYTDTSPWSRFGQWGHLETLDQPPASAPKYALLLEHFREHTALRHIDAPRGDVPRFTTDAVLPPGIAGQFYTADVHATGTVEGVGTYLDPGLSLATPSPGVLRVSGTPRTSRKNYVFARVHDADGDPAWRIFTLETFGGAGTLVQSDFRGASPALSLPWTATYVRDSRVTWSGWSLGAGAVPRAAENALAFSVSAPASANESLAQAIADDESLRATLTFASPLDLRGAEVRFSTRRIGFHSPLGYALFVNGTPVYVSSETSKDDFGETEHVATIPFAVTGPLEIRIYAFGAQFDGHATSLTAFKLTRTNLERRRAMRH